MPEVDRDMAMSGVRRMLASPPTGEAFNAIYGPWKDGFIVLTTEGAPCILDEAEHVTVYYFNRADDAVSCTAVSAISLQPHSKPLID